MFPSIQASMREPERFPAVLNVAYVVVAALCTFLGLAGYYMYGDGAMDVITFNMRSGAAAVLQHPHSDIRDSMCDCALRLPSYSASSHCLCQCQPCCDPVRWLRPPLLPPGECATCAL